MSYPALDNYLQRLSAPSIEPGSVWLNADGQAEGRFFHCVLTSAFQPIREVGAAGVAGFEGLARGVAPADAGLSVWRLLDHSANDDESIALDRLCRMLHAINFFRQPEADGADLYLSVHDRLLSAVSSNHGHAFRRILAALGLPHEQVVLQLPAVSSTRRWLLHYVADNYRRNGFRLALNVGSTAEAIEVLGQVRPAAIKIEARALDEAAALEKVLSLADAQAARVIVTRVESAASLVALAAASTSTGVPVYFQGRLIEPARADLGVSAACPSAAP